MVAILLGSLASLFGGAIAGNIGKAIGLGLGNYFGKHLEHAIFHGKSTHQEGTRLSDLIVQTRTYGKNIPLIFGNARVAGNIIFSSHINEESYTHRQKLDIFGINKATHTNYSYKVSLAIALAEGEIEEVTRIWANNEIVPMNLLQFRLYKGNESQLPDPMLERIYGLGKTPAYRGLAYIVFEDLALNLFGNKIPNFTFEVRRKMQKTKAEELPLEEKIKAMVIIPGSGEFVYDPIIQKKINLSVINDVVSHAMQSKINENNNRNCSDSLLSLEQLNSACPNLEWVAPVIGWFATSMDLNNCDILPGVEYKFGSTTEPSVWNVANYNRVSAHEISKDQYNNLNYGGTVNDESLIRYLDELKKRKYKIMLSPMFFMDV